MGMMYKSSDKGKGVVPCDHTEDAQAQGFSSKGIPSQEGASPGDTLAKDSIGKGTNETGSVNIRK